jgi:hypothetical protein
MVTTWTGASFTPRDRRGRRRSGRSWLTKRCRQ